MKLPRYVALHIIETTPVVSRVRTRQFWGSLIVGLAFLAVALFAWVGTP